MCTARARWQGPCVFAAAIFLFLVPALPVRAQTVIETLEQTNERIRSKSVNFRRPFHDYILGSGDVVSIQVFDVPELSRDVRISQSGTIGIPLVPVRLHIAGLTELQAEQKIEEVLVANGLVTHAQVDVAVKERKSNPITIVGAVAHPMVYQMDRQVTLLEALAEAGGISPDAGNTLIVTRPEAPPAPDANEPPAIGDESTSSSAEKATSEKNSPANSASSEKEPNGTASPSAPQAEPPAISNLITVNLNDLLETGDARNNILLQAGDIITVPHAGVVYALGAVGRPGGFVVTGDRQQLTTLKVLALAGGVSRTASPSHAVLVRKDAQGKQTEVLVDLKKVMRRETEDIPMRASDVLYVPDSGTKQVLLKALEVGVGIGSAAAIFRVAYR
jgi:polysaccharide export outer membrane protein